MNTLKEARKKAGLRQVDAANLCGVSRRTYQTYEEKGRLNNTDNSTYDDLLAKLEEMGINEYVPPILNIKFIKMKTSEIFAKYQEVKCAYLFGSYARNEATVKSDVDILVVAPNLDGFAFAGLHHELRTVLHKDVDLVNHTTLMNSEKMLRDLLEIGVKIYGQRINCFKD